MDLSIQKTQTFKIRGTPLAISFPGDANLQMESYSKIFTSLSLNGHKIGELTNVHGDLAIAYYDIKDEKVRIFDQSRRYVSRKNYGKDVPIPENGRLEITFNSQEQTFNIKVKKPSR